MSDEPTDYPPFSRTAVVLSCVSSVVWLVASLFAIFGVWGQLEKLQTSAKEGAAPPQAVMKFLWWHVTGSLDVGLIWLALAFGTLAGAAHCLYVVTGAVPDRDFTVGRLGWFMPQPLLAGVLGVLSLIVVRAGLVSADSGTASVSIFGAAAVAAGAGISAPAAFKRLAKLGGGTTGGTALEPKITTIKPKRVSRAGQPTKLVVAGKNLTDSNFTINGRTVTPTERTATSASLLLPNDLDISNATLLAVVATHAAHGSAARTVPIVA